MIVKNKIKKYIRYEKDSNGFPIKVICHKFNSGTLYGDSWAINYEMIFDKETHNHLVDFNIKSFRVKKRKSKSNIIPIITNVKKWFSINEN